MPPRAHTCNLANDTYLFWSHLVLCWWPRSSVFRLNGSTLVGCQTDFMYEKQKREQMQGCSHEIWSGTVAVGGDAGKGSGIELQKKNYLHFSVMIRMGSHDTFVLWRLGSVAFKLLFMPTYIMVLRLSSSSVSNADCSLLDVHRSYHVVANIIT